MYNQKRADRSNTEPTSYGETAKVVVHKAWPARRGRPTRQIWKRAGYVWYLIGERTASQPGCMEMVGIMQSVPVIRSPQSTKLLPPLLCTAASITDWNHFAVHTHTRTAARCALRIESPWSYSTRRCNGANCKPQPTTFTATSRDIILLKLSLPKFFILLDVKRSNKEIRWSGESFMLRANCYLCASTLLHTM